ncbi:MAG TPA: efflux RND transporter periplasmic adaptor subunit [Gemmataceae bacterium]|nr:efflux RND transporter periplasmic adaptor subunit [Gemmataceae bacterium]
MSVSFSPRESRQVKYRIGFGFVAAILAAAAALGCKGAPEAKKSKSVEVVVAQPVLSEVTDYQDFTGRLDALKTVDIRPRVSGYITDAPFVEGNIVKEGDLLFQIDPRPYQDEVNQAKANLKLAEADEVLQKRRAERGLRLMRTASGAVTPEDIDQLIAARDKAIANVGAMKATLERAELNLEFTKVTAPPLHDDEGHPLVGRISRRMVDPGNLVNADQTILTTLVSIDPMYAYFDVDERTYLEFAAITEPGANSWFSALQFPVLMRLANEDEFTRKGKINFLDNRLNANTGTVRMRGVFANPTGVLKSGLFVRVRLPKGVPHKMLLIPDEAVLSDQGRKYIYVLRKGKDSSETGNVAKYLSVTLGQSIGGLRAIVRKAGEKEEDDPNNPEQLKSYDRVIISGMQRVRPNAAVEIKEEQKREAPKSSLTKVLQDDRAETASQPHGERGKEGAAAPNLKNMQRLSSPRPHESRHEGKGRR